MLAYISKSCARVNPPWQLYGTTLALLHHHLPQLTNFTDIIFLGLAEKWHFSRFLP
jgi:hypothetical protein